MSLKYNILFRVCDKVESVHNSPRAFGLNKIQTIKVSFYSLYHSLQDNQYQITIIGDDLSTELLDFFDNFKNVIVDNEKLGSAAKSLQKQINISLKIPNDEWQAKNSFSAKPSTSR